MIKEATSWNSIISSLPGAHFMQTEEWAKVKAQTGWKPYYLVWNKRLDSGEIENYRMSTWESSPDKPAAAALVLQRTISVGGFALRLRVLYVPKGPLLDWENITLRQQVIEDLSAFTKRQGAIFIKIDPDVMLGEGLPDSPENKPSSAGQSVVSYLSGRGWHFSDEQVQFRNTVLLDLQFNEDDLLARMKQKTRYNLRLAERKGVIVRKGSLDDLPLLYQIYAETSIRDGFVIRSADYYYTTWKTFMKAGLAEVLIAEIDGEIIAGLILFTFVDKTWYVYGMSREIHREKMPNYLLQWRAMQHAKAKGCTTYDLWGAPDQFSESDPLWRVYRFKEGLGGRVVRHIGAWDLPVQPFFYWLYTRILPKLLDLMRKKGTAETKRDAGL